MVSRKGRVHVAVVGPSAADPAACEQAREIGALLAGRDAVVIVGGVGGVSQAAAEGASARDGVVVGLFPYYSRSLADPTPTVTIPTGMGELCNGLLVRSADALVSVGGGWGTLMEIALAQRTGIPVVSLNGWRLADARGEPIEGPVVAGTAAEAVRLAYEAALLRFEADTERVG